MQLSRRQWLSLAAGSGAARLLEGRPATPPLFEEIPPAQSGITWVHDNARSTEHYLPEALGPGCAFLDYDNDGWMDIYLVNSGACDFFQPSKPLRNALYTSRRHIRGRHGKSRGRRRDLRDGRGGWRLRQ